MKDIMSLSLGARFFVENGHWYGRIGGTHESKTIFVEATGETFPLTEDHGLVVTEAREDDRPSNRP